MEHEHGNGHDRAVDDAGNEPQRPDNESIQTLTSANSAEYTVTGPQRGDNEFAGGGESNDTIISVSTWNAIIPDPSSFNAYGPEVQKKIIEWTDENVLGSARRADRQLELVNRQATRSQWFTLLTTIASMALSTFAFIKTGSPLSLTPLTVPLLTVVVNIRRAKANEHDE